MNVATVTVAYNNPPQAGKKQGSIKTDTGEYYNVWPDKLHMFPKGATLQIEYQVREFNGKQYKTAVGVVGAQGPQTSHTTNPPTPAPKSWPQGDTQRPHTNGNGATGKDRDRHIFVCGVVNNAVRAGKVDPKSPSDIATVAKAAGDAFDVLEVTG